MSSVVQFDDPRLHWQPYPVDSFAVVLTQANSAATTGCNCTMSYSRLVRWMLESCNGARKRAGSTQCNDNIHRNSRCES